MATLLRIGVDATGYDKVERLAQSIDKVHTAATKLGNDAEGSSRGVKNLVSQLGGLSVEANQVAGTLKGAQAVLAGFKSSLDGLWNSGKMKSGLRDFSGSVKETSTNLSQARKELSEFITVSGKYAVLAKSNADANYQMSASLRAQEQAIKSLTALEGSYVNALAKENLMNDQAAISLKAKTAAINAQTAAYERLVAAGKLSAGTYVKGTNYIGQEYIDKGRSALRAGNYAAQMKAEEKLYDSVNGKMKEQVGVLNKLGHAWDEAGKKSSIFHNVMRGASGAMGSLWMTYGQLIPLLTGFAVVAGTIKTVNLGAEFDDLTRKIVILNQQMGEQNTTVESVKNSLLSIKDTIRTPKELAEGLLELARADVFVAEGLQTVNQTGGTTITLLEELSRFAQYAGISFADSATKIIGFSRAYGENAINVANTVARIADVSTADIGQMLDAMKNATSLNTVLGVGFNEVAAALGVLHDQGVKGATAGAALTTALTKLIEPTEKVKKTMAEIKFSPYIEGTGKYKDIVTLFEDIYKAAEKLPAQLRQAFLVDATGLRGLKALSAGVKDAGNEIQFATGKMKEFLAEANKAGGDGGKQFTYLQTVIEAMSKSGKYELDKLKAAVESLFVQSYENASVVATMKQFREVVQDPDTIAALQKIVDLTLTLVRLAAKAIVITVNYVASWSQSPMGGDFGANLSDQATDNSKRSHIPFFEAEVKRRQEALASMEGSPSAYGEKYQAATKALEEATAKLEKFRAEVDAETKAQEASAAATGKKTQAVTNMTSAQATALLEANKYLDLMKSRGEDASLTHLQKVQKDINKDISEQTKRWQEAGKAGAELTSLVNDYTAAVNAAYGPEIEKAKKADQRLTADEIAARRGAAAARKEETAALQDLVAQIILYEKQIKTQQKETDQWLKGAEKSIDDIEKLYKKYETINMSSGESYYYKQAEDIEEATRTLNYYGTALEETAVKSAELKKQQLELQVQISNYQAQLAANGVSGSAAEQDLTLQRLNERLIKNKEAQKDLISVTYRLADAEQKAADARKQMIEYYRDKSVWDSMVTGMKEVTYYNYEMARDIENATVNAFDSMTDALVEFIQTGKLNFKDFANSVIADILRIMVKAAIVGPIATYLSSGTWDASNTSAAAKAAGAGGMNLSNMLGYGGSLPLGSSFGSSLSGWGADLAFDGYTGLGSSMMGIGGWMSNNPMLSSGLMGGALSLGMSLLSGQGLNVQTGLQAAGAGIGSMFGPLGGVIGGFLGNVAGGLFGGDDEPPEMTLGSNIQANLDSTFNRTTGFDSKAPYYDPNFNEAAKWIHPVYNAYSDLITTIQEDFDARVKSIAGALPEHQADQFYSIIESVDYASILASSSEGRFSSEQIEEKLKEVGAKFSEGLLKAIGPAVGTTILAGLEATGGSSSFLFENDKVWDVLTEASKTRGNEEMKAIAESLQAGGDTGQLYRITQIREFMAQIAATMAPIDEIVATKGMSDYTLSIRAINKEFDDLKKVLTDANVDLSKYTELEEARAIKLAEVNKQLQNQKDSLQAQILRLEGDSAGALAIERRLELEAMEESLRPLQERIYALEDEADRLEKVRQQQEAINNIMKDVNDILATSGMTDLQKQIYSINKQYDENKRVLIENGATVAQLTDNEKARNIVLAEAMKVGYVDILKEAFDAEKTRLSEAFDIYAEGLNKQIDTAQETVNKLSGVVSSLKSAMSSMKMEGDEFAINARNTAQGRLQAALASARKGNFGPAENLGDTLSTLTQDGAQFFATKEEYQRDFYKTYNAMSQLERLAETRLSAAEQTVESLQKQLEFAEKAHEEELAALDNQLDAILGVERAVYSLADAIRLYNSSVTSSMSGMISMVDNNFKKTQNYSGLKQYTNTGGVSDYVKNTVKELSKDEGYESPSTIDPFNMARHYNSVNSLSERLATYLTPKDFSTDLSRSKKRANPLLSQSYSQLYKLADAEAINAGIDSDIYSRYRIRLNDLANGKQQLTAGELNPPKEVWGLIMEQIAQGSAVFTDATDGLLAEIFKRMMEGLPAFADGTNYVPRDMVAMIHKGEAVVPKAYNNTSNNSELIMEVQTLKSMIYTELGKPIKTMADTIDRWDYNGIPEERTV